MLLNQVILKFFMQLLLGKIDRIYKISYKTYLFEIFNKKKKFGIFFIELFFLSSICLKFFWFFSIQLKFYNKS